MLNRAAQAPISRSAAYTTPRPDVFELVPPDAASVLDVGCSNGALGASLRAAVPGRRVVGIELDVEFAREAGDHLDRVICANLESFDWERGLEGERFDCIVFADVLEHLIDPRRQLAGALRNLTPRGSVVVSLPNVRHLSALTSIFGRGTFPRRDRGLFDATHLRWFTIADGRRLLASAGLSVDAENYVLRAGDRGGGQLNRLLNRLPIAVQRWSPVREFLTYQFCLRARV